MATAAVLSASTYSMAMVMPRSSEVIEPGERQLLAQAVSCEVRVDGDHVDLTDGSCRSVGGLCPLDRMDLGPAESGQTSVALVEPETVGIEPRLALACDDHVPRPSTLLMMLGEGPVVHHEKGVLVGAGHERSGDDRDRLFGGQRSAHLEQFAIQLETERSL